MLFMDFSVLSQTLDRTGVEEAQHAIVAGQNVTTVTEDDGGRKAAGRREGENRLLALTALSFKVENQEVVKPTKQALKL